MSVDPLRTVHTDPLEREFESWIVWGIENYLQQIGRAYSIHAVSPGIERSWPADEKLSFSGKLVGLQMKQALSAPLKEGQSHTQYNRLKWSFAAPPQQHDLVKQFTEIYYCLPTFLNRDYRREAIHHCLFWRPDPNQDNRNAWYENNDNRVKTPYDALGSETRWGLFYENIVRCNAGVRIKNKGDIDRFLTNIVEWMEEMKVPFVMDRNQSSEDLPAGKGAKNWGGFYALVIEV